MVSAIYSKKDNPSLKILDFSQLFVADALMKKESNFGFWSVKSPMEERVKGTSNSAGPVKDYPDNRYPVHFIQWNSVKISRIIQ